MKHWYVVYTKPQQEVVADDHLKRQSFETCLPLIKEPRRIRRVWQEVIEPLFPRYLFIKLKLEADDVGPIRSTRGAIGLVRFSMVPTPLPEGFVEDLNQLADPSLGHHVSGQPLFTAGNFVKVLEGPLAGYTGIYQKDVGKKRALLLLDFLGRNNQVVFNYDQISPL